MTEGQSAEDGRIAEDLPGAHPFQVRGAGCTARKNCPQGALTIVLGVHYSYEYYLGVHTFQIGILSNNGCPFK